MKIRSFVTAIFLVVFGTIGIFITDILAKIILLFVGISQIYPGLKGPRTVTAIFGHVTAVVIF